MVIQKILDNFLKLLENKSFIMSEPILLIEYENIPVEDLININGILYQWVIKYSNTNDPYRQIVSKEDTKRLIKMANNAKMEFCDYVDYI